MVATLPQLAQQAVEAFINTQQELPLPPEGLDSFRQQQAGVFVTLKSAERQLRGCIGTISPVCDNVLQETIQNAISAATRDPRFKPVTPAELASLHYAVSILHPPEQVTSLEALDPKKYGVIVVARERRGLLLPDLEGINSAEEQVYHAMQKAGLNPGETITLYRFQVDKYEDQP